jgi:DNA-directed RNA polymerase-3 subunit RPC5
MPSLRSRQFPPEDSDDDDDEVLAKLPVYLSPHLFPTLNLFQYPLRTETLVPPKYAQERNKFITTRVKENVGRVEVEMPVDEDLNYWRRERAEELGFVRDVNEDDSGVVGGYGFGGREKEKEKSKGKKKEKHWGEKMRLKSQPIPNETGYYSGIIQDGELLFHQYCIRCPCSQQGALYLHPVTKVSQFRASLGYLDDFDEKQRSRLKRKGDETEDKKAKAGGVTQLALPARAKKVSLIGLSNRPAANANHQGEEENDGSGSLKQFREKMWSMAQQEEEDPWVTYEWRYGAVSLRPILTL